MSVVCVCVCVYLPQYADQQCQQQDACQYSYKDDPPGDPILVSKTGLRIDHYWNLEEEENIKPKCKIKIYIYITARGENLVMTESLSHASVTHTCNDNRFISKRKKERKEENCADYI